MDDLSRRDFLCAVPAALLTPTLLAYPHRSSVRLALVYSPEYERTRRAAEMSAAEVARAATLLKREFDFIVMKHSELTLTGDWTAIISATSQPFEPAGRTVVDVTGHMTCHSNVLKLTPARPPAGAPALKIWHHSLERFGAGQLNDRFTAAGITPIDDQAWLGWFGVKLLWEAAVRGRPPKDMSYDGHKGMALRFNRAGLLVQPLYAIEGDVIREVHPDAAQEDATCVS